MLCVAVVAVVASVVGGVAYRARRRGARPPPASDPECGIACTDASFLSDALYTWLRVHGPACGVSSIELVSYMHEGARVRRVRAVGPAGECAAWVEGPEWLGPFPRFQRRDASVEPPPAARADAARMGRAFLAFACATPS